MPKTYIRTVSLLISVLFLGIFMAPVVFAQDAPADTTTPNCDADGDGYISFGAISADDMALLNLPSFNANGNYTALEWQNFYNTFSNNPLSADLCGVLTFKKGAEPSRCDSIMIPATSGVYDPTKVQSLSGAQVNPDAFDAPDNGIDENCDGHDATLITKKADEKQLGNLMDKVMVWLSRAVVGVSVIVLIWGGMLYATAAGDEQKTAKARKAIIGAIIGLVVGLLAPAVVNWVTASLA